MRIYDKVLWEFIPDHWYQQEAEQFALELRASGWNADWEAWDGGKAYRAILASPPQVVVIYLTRLPSHGLQTQQALHQARQIPIIFVGGTAESIHKIRSKVPGALFSKSQGLADVLHQVLSLAFIPSH